jgi:hypothetical protein
VADVKATRPLEALDFFIADVQAGIGPFLGVFLQSRGWGADASGTVMSIGGLAGMLAGQEAVKSGQLLFEPVVGVWLSVERIDFNVSGSPIERDRFV